LTHLTYAVGYHDCEIGLYSMFIITFFRDRINENRKEKNSPLTICMLAQFEFRFFVDFDNRFPYIFAFDPPK
jgi:hypothetical protein